MGTARRWRPLALLLIFTIVAPAQVRRSIGKTSASGVTLRKRSNVNPLIAGAGTAELAWAGLYSFRQASWSAPASLHVTPAHTGFWSRTELGLASDTHTLSVTGTHVLVEREHFDIAVAPQATFFVRDGSGTRLGALAVVRYDHRDHTVSAILNWTAATRASRGNPEHLANFGLGYGWKRGRWSPHVNLVREVAT